jgi:hypothetical protein
MTWIRRLLGLPLTPVPPPPVDPTAEQELQRAKEGLSQAHAEHDEAEHLAQRLREMSRRNHFGDMIGEVLSRSQRR